MPAQDQLELGSLLALSARIGRDPLLVQASSGNTSMKIDGVLWIKASGKWLASALEEDCLVPVCLKKMSACLRDGVEFTGTYAGRSGCELRASIETAMHAVLPHAVVVHVHSVSTIAWAVRHDGPLQLAAKLAGLPWQWIDYVPSGLALALEINRALLRLPACQVFVLENHGLVVAAETCRGAEILLEEVERRLAVAPRCEPLEEVDLDPIEGWRLPADLSLHVLARDPVSREILRRGALYPCQAIFLAPVSTLINDPAEIAQSHCEAPFVMVGARGVLVRNDITRAQSAVLDGLKQVVQRIDGSAPIRYLQPHEIESLLSVDAYRYRQRVEQNAGSPVAV